MVFHLFFFAKIFKYILLSLRLHLNQFNLCFRYLCIGAYDRTFRQNVLQLLSTEAIKQNDIARSTQEGKSRTYQDKDPFFFPNCFCCLHLLSEARLS